MNRLGRGRARLGRALLLAAAAGAGGPACASGLPDHSLDDWLGATVTAADMGSLSLSPDERSLAFRTERADPAENRYQLSWHLLDVASGRTRPIADGGEAIVADPGLLVSEAPIWSPDGRWIYYRLLQDRQVQLWRAASDGSGAERLTSEPGDVEQVRAGDGSSLLYAAGPPRSEIIEAEDREYGEGILVDAHVELGQNVHRGALLNGRPASQRLTGRWFERGGLLWRRPLSWRRLDLATLRTQAVPAPADGAGEGVLTAMSSAGTRATSATERGTLEIVGRNGSVLRCRFEACTSSRITWLAFVPGREQLLFAAKDGAHAQKLWAWEAGRRPRLVASGKGLLSGGRSEAAPCAITRAEAICVEAAPNHPPRLAGIGLATGKRRILFDPNPSLRRGQGPIVRRLDWKDQGGRQFTGILFLPPGRTARRLPLFINYYRCEGFVRGGVGDEWPFAAMAMAGIAAACVNAAQLPGPQDGVGQYRVALGGLEALIDKLSRDGIADRRRIGVGGLSFGSEVAMWAAIHSRWVAAVSVASPQFEPASYWFNGVRGRDHHRILRQVWGLGAPEETPERWKLLSPALNVGRIEAPLLMQLSEQEARYAVELHARLTNSPTPAELYVFPDEPHIKVQPRHRLATYRRNLDWFRFWLKGEEDPDPAKAEQYERWRQLKERRSDVQPRMAPSQLSSETRSKMRK